MLRKLKNKIKFWAVRWIFKTYFGRYLYPFDRADDVYRRMPAHQKANYLKSINDWVNSEAYRMESQEIIRTLYQDLALKPMDEVMANAYRLAILIEQDKQKRLNKRAQEFNEIIDIT